MSITQSGRLLEQRAQEIFELINQTINEVRSKTVSPKIEIRIGTINSVSNRLIPSWIYTYKCSYPNVDIQISEASTTDILFYLDERKIDLGIVREPFNKAHYNYQQIYDEALNSHEIAQTPRRGDEDINAPAERFHLRDLTDPAEDGGASKRKAGSKALKIFKDLDGQFSGRC